MIDLKRRIHEARENDEGFTLIELAVVILIIGILLAIAIPNFLGVRQGADDRTAQASLKTALTLAKTKFGDTSDYTSIGTLTEPSMTISSVATGSAGPQAVVFTATATQITMASLSRSGTCWFIRDDTTNGTSFAKLASATSTTCIAGATGLTYGSKWS